MPKATKELKDAVRVHRIDVVKTEGDYKAIRREIEELSLECGRFVTTAYRRWLRWHEDNDSETKLNRWLVAVKDWHNADKDKRKEKPKCPVDFGPKEAMRDIRAFVVNKFPTLNSRVKDLLFQHHVAGKLKNTKPAKGSLPGWMNVILCRHQSLPGFNHGLPIPFDIANSELSEPATKDGNFRLSVRYDRIASEKKSPAKSNKQNFELMTHGRKMASAVSTMRKICDGESKFMGSNLVYDDRHNKVCVMLCYRQQTNADPAVHKDRVLIVRAGRKSPWRVRVATGSFRVLGGGSPITYARQRLLTSRWSRQEHYRYAGSSLKGHGRERALEPIDLLSRGWRDFVSNLNWSLASSVVRIARDRGCGTVVFIQPSDSGKGSRFLCTAGKVPGRHDSTGWDFYQAKDRLSQKCVQSGIECEVAKHRERAVKPKRKAG